MKPLLLIPVLALVGCASQSNNYHYTDPPIFAVYRGYSAGVDTGRIDPWQRIEAMRATRDPDVKLSWTQGNPIDADTVLADREHNVYAAFREKGPDDDGGGQYVLLGRDFYATGETGGASQAYWAALRYVGASKTDRPAREVTRQGAYQGLAQVAGDKGQRQWQEMLIVCANLSSAYSASAQAQSDKAQTDKLAAARTAADQAKAQADRAAAQQSSAGKAQLAGMLINAVVTGAATGIGGGSGLQSLNAGVQTIDPDQAGAAVGDVASANAEAEQADAAYSEAVQDIDHATATAAVMQPDEGIAIESGKSFFAEEVTYYLIRASDQTPYLAVLDLFASDKPQLQMALAQYRTAQTDDQRKQGLDAIALQCRQYELFVATYERRGIAPPDQSIVKHGRRRHRMKTAPASQGNPEI